MKRINNYINESETKHPLWCMVVLSMLKGAKNVTKESISNMILTMCDVDGRLKKFSNYLADTYPKEYLAYQPNDDEFINKDNNDKLSNQIAEFIIKYVI